MTKAQNPNRVASGLLFAALSIGALKLAVWLFPSLLTAPIEWALAREATLILGSIALALAVQRWTTVPATRMGWIKPSPRALGWGLLCGLAILLVSAATIFLMRHFGLAQNASVLAAMGSKPVWLLVLVALTAAISEEIVFRGIALSQIENATNSTWIGAVVSLVVFAVMHLSVWGWSQVFFAAIPGLVLTLFFLWKRNLTVVVIGHFLTDLIGLLGAYAQAHHP